MRPLSLVVAVAFVPVLVLAQEDPDAGAPVITPPSLLEFVEAEYPAAAAAEGREANVELELTIGVQGEVLEARVVTPVGHGFDEAALAAVQRFRFEPARRNGEPIPARIRYVYVFEQREQLPPPPEPDAPPPPGRIEGRLIGQEDGDPIAEAEVILTSEDQAVARRALTGDDGTFRFDDLPPGPYRLRILTSEYGESDQREEVVSNESTEVTYRLEILRADDEGFGATAVVDPPPREVTRRVIRREELTRIPGTRGDALRAIELLPGVGRPAFGSGTVIIRGASPNDSQVFVEGIPVPLLYHFGGLTSIIPSRLLERIDFIPGNFSSRYGRKTGGVVEVGLRDPRRDGLHGVAEFSAIDFSLLAEFPLGERASAALGARRSFIDVIFTQVLPEDLFAIQSAPVYYDYQAFITWRPTDRDRLRFNTYGANDRFAIIIDDSLGDDPAIRGNIDLTTRFTVMHLGWDRQINDKTELDIDLSYTPTRLQFSLGQDIDFDLLLHQVFGRVELRHRATERVRLIAGLDMFYSPYRFDFTGPPVRQTEGGGNDGSLASQEVGDPYSSDGRAYRPSLYLESDMRLTEDLQVVLGMRLDYDRQIEEFVFDPRLVARLNLTSRFRIKGGIGLYSQPPEFQESAPMIANPNLEMIRSLHTGGGFELDLAEGIQVGVEGFYKWLWDRVVGTVGGLPPFFTNDGVGRIYGAEVSGRVEPINRRFFGFLSYTLMRSERRDREGEDYRLFDFDQTHIFTLAGVYKLPKNWEVGATMRIVSGNPTTPVIGAVYQADVDSYYPISGEVNSARNPLFHRLDLRVEKQWIFSSWKLALFLDIQNVYNRQNQEGIAYNYNFTQSIPVAGLPIIPAIGIRGEL